MSLSSMVTTKEESRATGAITRNFIPHPHLGATQVSGSVWKYVTGMAGGEQKWEKKGEKPKGWDAQSSSLPVASPLWICSPPHPKYKLKRIGRHSVFIMLPCKAVGRTLPLSWWNLRAIQGVTGKGTVAALVRVLGLHRCWLRTAAQDGAGLTWDFPHNYSGCGPSPASREKTDGNPGISVAVAFWGVEK